MAGKWLQPFPWNVDRSTLKLLCNGRAPWLEVEIAGQNTSIACVRAADLALGKRLEVQLRMAQHMAELLAPRFCGETIRIQLHDEDPGVGCLRMDAATGADTDSSPLIPDPYCLGTNGYAGFREQLLTKPLPAWSERLPVVFWRGATTGNKDITTSTLESNLRYQLCRRTLSNPARVDARFNQVVQCLNASSKAAVEANLRRESLMGTTVGPWHASLHAWLIDIDGNVNSWGLLWKLLSGSCVLRVFSHRQQWFHRRMIPWIHVVPIAPDLSNFDERVEWCLENQSQCETIAAAGQRLGMQILADLNHDLCSATVRYAQHWLKT
ncbi:glycosyl transferase family 90 [Synechococcus sp. BS55D]|uniref:glycosyl transferase family 90 n=1 Tax=Synechococcus sp. BS55D TaxID=2055943 RepID=UPI00103A7CF0|nr:glycosyl transferase family 90 [Synechococcus sp. BS55D]TCD58115.1 hypothetical protein CWE16_02100 [Synechococcus sp. BS55D]